jgi:hypothetical protein
MYSKYFDKYIYSRLLVRAIMVCALKVKKS